MKRLLFRLLMAGLLLAPQFAHAATYYVAKSGSNTNGGASWDDAWKTIQYAINQVSDSDTIIVRKGIYQEDVTVAKNDITLKSEFEWASDSNPNSVAIKALGPEWAVEGETLMDDHIALTITGSGVTIKGFEIFNGTVEQSGAGLYISGADATVENCYIHDNGLYWDDIGPVTGAGICVGFNGNNFTIKNSLLKNNTITAPLGSNYGGGIYFETGSHTVQSCTVVTNYSGIGICASCGTVALNESILWDNSPGQDLDSSGLSKTTLTSCFTEDDLDSQVKTDSTNIIHVDPQFICGDFGSYYLQGNSIGKAFKLDGNTYVDFGDILDSDDTFSIEVWFYLTAFTPINGHIVSNGGGIEDDEGYIARVSSGGQLRFSVADNYNNLLVTYFSGISLETWYHMVAVKEGDSLELYVDGQSRDTASYEGFGSHNNLSNLYVGASQGGSYKAKAYVDGLRYYNKALTLSEILSHYHTGVGTPGNPEANLQLLLNFEDGTTTIDDDSNNNNDGTIMGNSNWVTGIVPIGGIDSGSVTASSLSKSSGWTTQRNNQEDVGTVDMGFHYQAGAAKYLNPSQ